MADNYTFTAIITDTHILVKLTAEYEGKVEVVFTESRPADLAEADTALAAHGFGRVRDWDLGPNGTVQARVAMVDNQFNGTRAARLWDAIGTTHEELETVAVGIRGGMPTINDGDLITDMDESELYVVAGSRFECGTAKIHQVGEGKTWDQRYTGYFPFGHRVKVARRKA